MNSLAEKLIPSLHNAITVLRNDTLNSSQLHSPESHAMIISEGFQPKLCDMKIANRSCSFATRMLERTTKTITLSSTSAAICDMFSIRCYVLMQEVTSVYDQEVRWGRPVFAELRQLLTPKAAVKPSTRGYFEEVLFLFNVLYRSDPELLNPELLIAHAN
jgi:hypothetical protein